MKHITKFISIIFTAAVIMPLLYAQKAPIAISPKVQVKVSDIYNAGKYVNPFAEPATRIKKKPPVKGKRTVKKAAPAPRIIVNEPTLDSLRLTGIMLSGDEKQAILYDLNTRQTYFLIGENLYNRDVKKVRGFSGKKSKTITLPGKMARE
jgi:hypothetical protein